MEGLIQIARGGEAGEVAELGRGTGTINHPGEIDGPVYSVQWNSYINRARIGGAFTTGKSRLLKLKDDSLSELKNGLAHREKFLYHLGIQSGMSRLLGVGRLNSG